MKRDKINKWSRKQKYWEEKKKQNNNWIICLSSYTKVALNEEGKAKGADFWQKFSSSLCKVGSTKSKLGGNFHLNQINKRVFLKPPRIDQSKI